MFNLTVIGTLGGQNSRAYAIDAFRRVAGDSDAAPANDLHALLFDGASQDLGVLPLPNPFAVPGAPTFELSTARGIGRRRSGDVLVVGFSSVGSFAGGVLDRAFRWTNGMLQEIGTLVPAPGTPGAFLGGSRAFAANGNALVVGVSDTAALGPNLLPLRRAFEYDADANQMTALPTLWADPNNPGLFLGNSEARGVADDGRIVGVSDTGTFTVSNDPIRHAFLFDPRTGQMQDLGTLLPDPANPGLFLGNSEARCINGAGQIVGVSDSTDASGATVQRAFLLDAPGAGMRDLGTLRSAQPQTPPYLGNSEANSINGNGVVVGVADTAAVDANGDPIRHGFLWDPTVRHPEDLNDPPLPGGWTLLEATGINQAVDICGHGADGTGAQRGLLLFR